MADLKQFYRDKTLLITGATGFLGKPLVEKILRQLPEIRRAYLLVRTKSGSASSHASVRARVEKEILRSSIFTLLREAHGDRFWDFAAEKIVAIPGDVSMPQLGLTDDDFQLLTREVDVIINSAAVVVFDERLDYAVESNTHGPSRLLEFAHQCRDPVFLHVSTAYVGGLRSGRVPETLPEPGRCAFDYMDRELERPFNLDEQIRDVIRASNAIEDEATHRDANGEFLQAALKAARNGTRGADAKVRQEAERLRKRWIGDRLVKEGVSRARSFGWNDTYTFTKAMGEQRLVLQRGGVPSIILRPSIIESSYAEPEAGWIDGFRMADPLIAGYGKGRIPDFPVDPTIILDFIPVDFVVNALLAAVPTARSGGLQVFHVASSTENPLFFSELVEHIHEYFLRYPMRERDGTPIRPKRWNYPTEAEFLRWVTKTDAKFRAAIRLCEAVSFYKPAIRRRRELMIQQAGLERLAYYNQIYGHYVRLHCQYETSNTRRLYESLSKEDQRQFLFAPGAIDWREYLQEIHVPGLKRHILKMEGDVREPLAEDDPLADQVREPELQNLNQLLERAARRWPDHPALQARREGRWQAVTYGQLRQRVLSVAAGLRECGLRHGDRALLVSENQPEWALAFFACSALGIAVVPLDRQTRADEAAALASLVGAKAVLASELLGAKLTSLAEQWPLLNVNNWCRPFGSAAVPAPPWDPIEPVEVESDEIASIIFTTGSVVDAKGAQLSHRNFIANVLALAEVLEPYASDRMLAILPLNHAFEFTCDLLTPMLGGATVSYLDSMKSRDLLRALNETQTTCMLGIPRVFELLRDHLEQGYTKAGPAGRALWGVHRLLSAWALRANRPLLARRVFARVHEKFGGHLRLLVSGGAALDPKIHRDFTLMGFRVSEGYGLTETSPVLTVNPLENSKRGSVGRALPCVRLRILNPDPNGVGEIIARGPNVFRGYCNNPLATEKVFRDGWFLTGDLGYLDEDGYLFITGRLKEVIVTSAGKNVYPEEVEALYRGAPGVREICVVGMRPAGQLGEEVHAVIVAGEAEDAVHRAVQQVSRNVASYQRPQRLHFWRDELPKSPALLVDRAAVKERLRRELGSAHGTVPTATAATDLPAVAPAVLEVLCRVARVPVGRVTPDTNLQFDLQLDSLKRVDMLLALDERFGLNLPEEAAAAVQTVRDVVDLIESHRDSQLPLPLSAAPETEKSYWERALASDGELEALANEPGPGGRLLRGAFRRVMRSVYRRRFRFTVSGLEHLPTHGPYIIAPNHTSHLDGGAVLLAVESRAPRLRALGARDYFFNSALQAWFFRTLFSVVPFDRQVNFMEGLRVGRLLLQRGMPLLIFPEGTRSTSGQLQPFKPGIGLLAYELDVPIVPAYLQGAYVAWPKGQRFPGRGRVSLRFGPPIRSDQFRAASADRVPYETYQAVVAELRTAIERLRDETFAQDA